MRKPVRASVLAATDQKPSSGDAPVRRRPMGLPLDPASLEVVRSIVSAHGLTEAAHLLGMARNTVAQAAAGAGLREGTRLQLAIAIATAQTGSKA